MSYSKDKKKKSSNITEQTRGDQAAPDATKTQNVPADSLPTTNVTGTGRFDGAAVSAARAVARNALSDVRGGILRGMSGEGVNRGGRVNPTPDSCCTSRDESYCSPDDARL
jgi:hypothetical protein